MEDGDYKLCEREQVFLYGEGQHTIIKVFIK